MATDPTIEEGTPEEESKPAVVSPIENQEATPLPKDPEPVIEAPEEPPAPPEPPPPPPPPPTVVPVKVTNLSAVTGVVSGEVQVTADPVEADSYELYWTDDALTPVDPEDANTYRGTQSHTEPDFTIAGLIDSGHYEFYLRAVNVVGPSDLSDPLIATPAPPPAPDVPTNLTLEIRAASGQVDVSFDAMERASGYELYWTLDALVPIDESDATTYVGQMSLTTSNASITGLSDGVAVYVAVKATSAHGDSALTPKVKAVPTGPTDSLQTPPEAPETSKITVWDKTLPKVSFLPLRLIDEEIGRLFQENLQRLHPLEESKSLENYLQRKRLLYFASGEGPMEILGNLFRVAGRERVKLPVVVLHRATAVEAWDTEHSLMPHMERHPAMLGFHPIRLNYTLTVIAFEQPVCDTLVLALYALLKSNYRFEFPISGHDFQMQVSGLFLDTASLTFTNELVTREEQRLFASRADFSVGTYSYHLPAEAVEELPIRFVFDRLQVQGNQGHKT